MGGINFRERLQKNQTSSAVRSEIWNKGSSVEIGGRVMARDSFCSKNLFKAQFLPSSEIDELLES
jgi:hypothetical protein